MASTVRVFRPGGHREEAASLDDVSELRHDPDALIWVDLESPTETEVAAVASEFGLDELIAEDIAHGHQRPKILPESDPVFLVAYGIDLNAGVGKVTAHEVTFLITSRSLVTVRRPPEYDLTSALARIGHQDEIFERGVAHLVYVLLDEIVDGYFVAVDNLETAVDAAEGSVFAADGKAVKRGDEQGIQERIFAIRRQVVTFYQISVGMREVLNGIVRRDLDLFPDEMLKYFQDVYDHLLRVNSSLEVFRDLVSGMFEAHLAVVNNQLALQGNEMNAAMKKMTSWGAILLGATLITGIYGMNFDVLPGKNHPYGAFIALGAMVALTIVLYGWFKKKNWL